ALKHQSFNLLSTGLALLTHQRTIYSLAASIEERELVVKAIQKMPSTILVKYQNRTLISFAVSGIPSIDMFFADLVSRIVMYRLWDSSQFTITLYLNNKLWTNIYDLSKKQGILLSAQDWEYMLLLMGSNQVHFSNRIQKSKDGKLKG